MIPTPSIRCAIARALVAAAALTATVRAQETNDTVALKNGTLLQGTIKDEDFAGVSIDASGKNHNVIWDDVQSVTFGDAPTLAPALSALTAKRLDEAESALTELAGAAKPRTALHQEVLFYQAVLAQARDDLDGALSNYRKLLADHPKGRYVRLACENLVTCLVAKQSEGEIGPELDKLAAAAGPAAGVVKLVHARFDESRNREADARKVYDELKNDPQPQIAAQAKLGLAGGLLRDKKNTEAEAALRAITTSAAPATVLAGAWNGLGDLYSEEGKRNRDSEKLLDAAYAYLRGVVQYKPLPGESTAEYERALAGAARCFKHISELETNDARKKLFAARATERTNLLRAEFPHSIYLEAK